MTLSHNKIIGSIGVVALVAGTLLVAPAAHAAVGSDAAVVIDEVYGGGGAAGAVRTNDFIELYNTTDAAVDLAGWSLQYKSAAGTTWSGSTVLTGSIPAKSHFLISGASDGAAGEPLPTPDVAGTINLSRTAGNVALVNNSTKLTCVKVACATEAAVVDLVGFGTGDTPAGSAAPAPSLTTSISRNAQHANTADNSADFTAGLPGPENSGQLPVDPGDPVAKTIAEIQGAGETSPLAGSAVTTTGVVTAAYPAGGFAGFTIQTPGTGGPVDPATHTTSDAVFVYSPALVSAARIGDLVQVSGVVDEFFGLTEITAAAGGLTVLDADAPPIEPATTDSWPAAAAQRESLESMLYQPIGEFTVTDTFGTNQYGEVGLAAGSTPLIQPTDVARPGTPEAAAVAADNAARSVVLDDGATIDFLKDPNKNLTPPYISLTAPVRVGEAVTWDHPVIVDYRNDTWKFNPTSQVTPDDVSGYPASFKNNRVDAPDEQNLAQPDRGQPDIKIASFNVLNYFTTLGATVVPPCTSFNDRAGNPIAVDSCPGTGPRGAWNAENLKRQQDKIVHAINALDADVVGLSEIENSVVVGGTKDAALSTLVDALNTAAGAGTWAFVPSSTELPPAAQMDVITNAIIYQPKVVTRLGNSRALGTQSSGDAAFANAREPIAQVFAPVNGTPFLFVMNHFKSKGSGGPLTGDVDSGDGQGSSNASRVAQATALRDWVQSVKGPASAVALVGDFNSYGQEDPLKVLYDAGYVDAEQQFKLGKSSYSFDGLSGSLDHILINPDALGRATGADIWNINSPESIALQYSRYNYHGTLFYDDSPFASSDHDPVVLGLKAGLPATGNRVVQILGINDFHGRIQNNGQTEAGAAVLSGAVDQLRNQYPDTVFAAAGDLIGASTFESFIQKDKPTLDALNAAGLQVSAVGNHEFDQGYNDLVNRVMAPYDPVNNPLGGAAWKYLGANVRHADDDSAALPESWVQNFGTVKVGFVGAVTDHLPELVSPAGIAGLNIEAPVVAANREADKLKAAGADIVILLVHEGAATTDLAAATDPASDFGRIVTGVDANIDAIVSGHTHLTYNHLIPVQAWIDEGRPVTTRPVVSAGQYGYNLDQLLFTVDGNDKVVGVESKTLPLVTTNPGPPVTYTTNYPADPDVATIVAKAVADSAGPGAVALGKITAPFNRAKLADGTTENRGGESTLGNLVAEVQRWATESETTGSAQIALMNPGGLRADMIGNAGTPATYPADLTYKQAAVVQPFANTLVNMDLTGAQLKTVLEQQWQPAGAARPFLRLGLSKGFTYTYDPAAAAGSHITHMWLNGVEITATTSYSVTVNSFLATGGDNFGELAKGTGKQDTGQTDLEAMVDYMAANAVATPLAPDYTQRSVGVTFPAGSPAEYAPGDTVGFGVSSLAFSTAPDAKDTQLALTLDGVAVGTAAVDNTIGTDIFDEYGKANVSFVIPAGTAKGAHSLGLTGNVTGTTTTVPLTISGPTVPVVTTTVKLEASPQTQVYGSSNRATFTATVTASDGTAVTGQVEFRRGDVVVATQPITDGKATFRVPADTPVGTYTVTARYLGADPLPPSEPSAPQSVTIQQAASQTLLISTASSFRQGALLPPIMIAGVGLNNGQLPRGVIRILVDGQPGQQIPLTLGLALYIPSRSLSKGPHTFAAVFEPSDPTNIGGSTSPTVTIQVR